MTIVFRFDKQLVDNKPELFKHISNSYPKKFVSYLLHSDYRQAVNLEGWIKQQVDNPSVEINSLSKNIDFGIDDDETVINVLQAIINILDYVGDVKTWGMPEYWQTAQQTLDLKTGDCEDGAILAYVLCRLKGISPDKLMLFCGDVSVGGHCWLAYRPLEYPLNWVFLDWCYWATEQTIGKRNFYYIKDTTVYGEYPSGSIDERYKNIWFGFNEEQSVLSMKYNF